MKKQVLYFVIIDMFLCLFNLKTYSQTPKLTASVNPLGLLFFGPGLNVGYSINNNTTVNLDIRRNSMGLAARAIRGNDPELYRFKGMGYAIGATRFKESIESGMYYGAYLALDIQKTKYLENSPWAWHETTKTFAGIFNAGKRFKYKDKFFLNAGGVVGAGVVKYDWEYDDAVIGIGDPEERSGHSFMPILALELAFGVYLLR